MGLPVSWQSHTMALRMSLSFHSHEVTSQGRWMRVRLLAALRSIAMWALLWVCRNEAGIVSVMLPSTQALIICAFSSPQASR